MYSEAQQYQYHYEMLINLGKVLNRIAYGGCIIEQKACAWHVLGREYSTLQQAKDAVDESYGIIAASMYPEVLPLSMCCTTGNSNFKN